VPWFVFSVTLGLTVPALHAQATWYVDDEAPPGGDGGSWATALPYLQDALSLAETGSEVRVGRGTYRPDVDSANPNGTGDQAATFQLRNGVALRGGYAGFGSPDPNDRDITAYETILSGDLLGNDVGSIEDHSRDENSTNIVTGSGTDATAVLDGFTIAHGGCYHCSFASSGAGMLNDRGSPTTIDCAFVANVGFDGGGMLNYGGQPTVTGCTFLGNLGGKGGGMHNLSSSPIVSHCRFFGNHGRSGGAIYNEKATLVVTNSLFAANTASHGAGIVNWNAGHAVISTSTFADNLALGGSAVAIGHSSSATLIDCILADSDEELEVYTDATMTVTFSSIRGGWPNDDCPVEHPNCNTGADPLFVPGPRGCYYLSHAAAGQSVDSPCVDAGSDTAENLGLDTRNTRSDSVSDMGVVDLGYHYAPGGLPRIPGDYNLDREVDFEDFAAFQACFTGSGPVETSPCCRILDFEPDADVDLDDYAAFLLVFTP